MENAVFTVTVESSNATSEAEEYDYSAHVMRVRSKFFIMAVIIPLGLLFNTTAFTVFMRSSSLRKATTTHFLIALTFSDSSYLIGELLQWLNTEDPYWRSIFGLNFIHTSNVWCRVPYFLRYFGQFFSAWLTVAITVERCLCISFPLKIGQLSTKFTTRLTIIGICLVSITLNSYAFWVFGVRSSEFSPSLCDTILRTQYNVWTWTIFRTGAFILPSVVVFIFTGLILVKLRKISQVRRELSAHREQSTHRPSDRDERQIMAMLLLVAIAFLILRLPYNILLFIHEYVILYTDDSQYAAQIWLMRDVTYAIAAVNYAINFFLFCLSGSIFRQKILACLMCKKKAGIHSNSSRTSRVTMYTKMSQHSSHGVKTTPIKT